MTRVPFTHLHLHTQYSLLDGAIKHDALFERLAALGQEAIAMTDHGNLFGAVDFYEKARAAKVKIIGPSRGYDVVVRAFKAWADGSSTACPDMTKIG